MTERELERRAQHKLAVLRHVEEVSFNVAATCRYYGISRQCYYGWLRRYQADGLDGLMHGQGLPGERASAADPLPGDADRAGPVGQALAAPCTSRTTTRTGLARVTGS